MLNQIGQIDAKITLTTRNVLSFNEILSIHKKIESQDKKKSKNSIILFDRNMRMSNRNIRLTVTSLIFIYIYSIRAIRFDFLTKCFLTYTRAYMPNQRCVYVKLEVSKRVDHARGYDESLELYFVV